MIRSMLLAASGLATLFACTGNAWGHFPWLVRNSDGTVEYFFGEGLTDRMYKLPPSIATAKVYAVLAGGENKALDLKSVERDDFVGLQGGLDLPADAVLAAKATFGIYHGARLDYYTLHLGGSLPTSREAYKSRPTGLDLSAEVVDTADGVDVFVTWKGEPLSNVEVHLYCDEGHEEGTATTDAAGKVSFTAAEVEEGVNGVMLGHTVEEAGKLKDVAYARASHYLTLTFMEGDADSKLASSGRASADLAPLPFAITSFAAVRHGDAFYVYGGHTGTAHSYSNEAQSNKLLKLDLSKPGATWQELAEGPRLQGLGMVAHGDQLILVGGFTAMNEEGEEHDLRSQASVLAYDLKSGQWSELPSLPESRSSHDAAMVDDKLIVVGGWSMAGDDTTWHTTAWSLDLSEKDPQWSEIAKPPFVRRALATVAHRDRLFVLGGMDEKGGPTRAVDVYDPSSNSWTEVAELIGKQPMAGFGAAGWSLDGTLVVSTYEGDVQRWNDADGKWEVLGQTADARFFHRLLPLEESKLVSLGGANMEQGGKFLDLEVIAISEKSPEYKH